MLLCSLIKMVQRQVFIVNTKRILELPPLHIKSVKRHKFALGVAYAETSSLLVSKNNVYINTLQLFQTVYGFSKNMYF